MSIFESSSSSPETAVAPLPPASSWHVAPPSLLLFGPPRRFVNSASAVSHATATALGERLEMKLGDVLWSTPRRNIPFGPPQRFWVPKDSKISLEQDRKPSDYTALPIPPTPPEEKVLFDKEMEKANK